MYYPTLYKLYIFVFGFDKPLEVINKKLRPTNEGNEKLTIDPTSLLQHSLVVNTVPHSA